jgi:MerR family transcriptional regulator/heat shock protein HspR
MTQPPSPSTRITALDDATYPAYAVGAAAEAIGVTAAFLRSAEAAGLFEAHRSDGGHRRYSREDLHRADRARQLVNEGIRMDAAVRIVGLEFQLAAAQAMIEILRRSTTASRHGGPDSEPPRPPNQPPARAS